MQQVSGKHFHCLIGTKIGEMEIVVKLNPVVNLACDKRGLSALVYAGYVNMDNQVKI